MIPKAKIEWCDFQERFLVMVYGNPFRQVYESKDFEKCSIILQAYNQVGYEDVTDWTAPEFKDIVKP
jgi:hypothetical protein